MPQLREMLLRALRNPSFNELHSRWVAAQERAICEHDLDANRHFVEIVNHEGSITLSDYAKPSDDDSAGFVLNSLAVGMLITAYDADSLIGRLLSLRDWRTCGDLQKEWSDLVLLALHNNRGKITNLAEWDHLEEAEDFLGEHIKSLGGHRSRLIRYIIEQAAVNFTHAMLRVSRAMGFSSLNWPDEPNVDLSVSEMMAQEMEGWWPVVGIRLDYLIRGHGKLMRRRLRRKASKEKRIMKKVELEWHNRFVAQPLPGKKKSAPESDDLTYEEPGDPETDEDEDEIDGW